MNVFYNGGGVKDKLSGRDRDRDALVRDGDPSPRLRAALTLRAVRTLLSSTEHQLQRELATAVHC